MEVIMAVKINVDTCIGCGACENICPVNAISMNDSKAVVDADTCIDCGNCIEECPVEAIASAESEE